MRPVSATALLVLAAACGGARPEAATRVQDDRAYERNELVDAIELHGIEDPRVIEAMRTVPRHSFVPASLQRYAYADRPLPIGHEQTISQPYIVAYMTEALELSGGERVLEIGTGSGYQAAVLAEVAREVYSIEILEPLAEQARTVLEAIGYTNLHLRTGDGYRGWPEAAPFDAIILTAAPRHVPEPLLEQLAVGGRMVLPVGGSDQELIRLRKTSSGVERERLLPVRFVPMTGEVEARAPGGR